jgi:hypothetical protein
MTEESDPADVPEVVAEELKAILDEIDAHLEAADELSTLGEEE